jgi:hypothetical protein
MRILCSLFVLMASLAVSQTVEPTKGSGKLLEQFEFPKPFNGAAVQRAFSGQPQILVLPGTKPQPADSSVCAVRLLEYKADASIDPGIRHSVGPSKGSQTDKNAATDKMPFRLPMPACPAQR